jgi:16S rRNA (cytosine967-C5)-methyltransferase
VQTSHPRRLIERWVSSFGLETAASFAQANNNQPPTVFRLVTTQANEADVLGSLESAGAELEKSALVSGAWRVSGATAKLRELVADGQIYLQDEASQLVAQTVAVSEGHLALDLCAAPGGKTTMMADRAGGAARIVAADLHQSRLDTIERTTRLHKLTSVETILLNAGQTLPFPPQTFDRVLVDAPCSGTGTLRHNPEIRWRISAEDIKSLSEQQKKFLCNAAAVVRPGGRLVYSTCSVEVEENEEVVQEFLEQDKRFFALATGEGEATTRRTWPQIQGCDGFFMATFERRTD